MKDMVILIGIIVFWFLLSFTLNEVFKDEFITSQLVEVNSSYEFVQNSSTNFYTNESSADPLLNINLQRTTFWSMLVRTFTFRIPIPSAAGIVINTIISFVNWFLLLLFGLIVYRQIRSGSG